MEKAKKVTPKKKQEEVHSSKKSIIIGITALFVIMLILLGLTYAYYRTRVIGNDKNTLSVVSKLLEITYDDEEATMNMTGLIEPDFEFTKVFYVKNTGDESVTYAVYLEEVINTFVNQDTDPVYFELTCASNINGNTCNGYDGEIFPEENTKLVSNTVEKGEIHTYTLNVNYPETGLDQSDNMGKQLAGKVQIYDETVTVDIEGSIVGANAGDYVEINSKPKRSQIRDGKYKLTAVELGEHTLYIKDKNGNVRGQATLTINKGTQGVSGSTITIDNDSQTATLNITSISTNLGIEITKVSEEKAPFVNPYTEGTLAYEILNDNNDLPSAEDDYTTTTGNLSYYYRGAVENNYVNYSGMCWRIVRIEGDGSVKLVLSDEKMECDNGYDPNNENGLIGIDEENYIAIPYDNFFGFDFVSAGDGNVYKVLIEWSKKLNSNSLENEAEWCIDTSIGNIVKTSEDPFYTSFFEYYGSYSRLNNIETANPIFKCSQVGVNNTKTKKYKNSIGILTADEFAFAGAVYETNNNTFYLDLKQDYDKYFTLSPHHRAGDSEGNYGDGCAIIFDNGSFSAEVTGSIEMMGVRPAVVIKNNSLLSSNTISTQDGSYTNPYVID